VGVEVKNQIITTSPLEGEVCFQCEQKLANIRKQGEGKTHLSKIFDPSPIFLTLVPRVEKVPLPQVARGKSLIFLLFFILLFCFSWNLRAQAASPLVRVGISNNSFKSVVYSEVSIFATADYAAYEKSTSKPIIKFASTDIVKIKESANGFELSVNNKSVAKNIKGTIVFDCPKGLLGVENLKRNGKQAVYHGIFEVTPKIGTSATPETSFFLVNVLDLETYLKGVVPNEMPVRFGIEALKAQAIAARNYAMTPRTRSFKEFDVDDSVSSQVYFGAATESELSNKAVMETEGLVALYDWELILAQYSSTAGGYTESYEYTFSDPKTKEFPSKSKPYLQGRPDILSVGPLNREEEARLFYMSCPDSYDMKSPYYRWQREWTATELHDVLEKTLVDQSKTGFIKLDILKSEFKKGDVLGELKELKVDRRGVSGKIVELEIVTDKETYHVFKELVIRRLLQKNGASLPSANVVFENLYDTNKKLNKIVAYGGGFGHGVGMSQYGAGFMSTSLHKSFDKILKRYYTGITISTCPVILASNDVQNVVTQTFFAPYKKAILVVDNKYKIDKFSANINGSDVVLEMANSIIPYNRMSRIDISSYIKQGKNNITFYFPGLEKPQGLGGKLEGKIDNKAIRLYVELVEKDDSEYKF